MSPWKKAKLVWGFGIAIYEAIANGRKGERVEDVLPARLRAEAHLLELEQAARRDYEIRD